jgi:nitrate/TMAO reductase-like tetraheme cytochrome c subunit
MKARSSRIAWRTLAAVGTLLLAAGPSAGQQMPPSNDEYSEEDANACLDCHENDYVMGIFDTAHGKADDPKAPAAQRECQSCHGPSAKHMMFPMQVENVHFGKKSTSTPDVQNELCLECHAEGAREDWHASAHGFEKVVCSSCHSMHQPSKVVPEKAAISAGCTDGCHEELMGEAKRSDFTHPIGKDLDGKGELTCAGCHNPHGPLDSTRCVECHPQTADLLAKESEKAKRFHKVATAKGTDCVRCHKGIAHPIPPLALEASQREMNELMAE